MIQPGKKLEQTIELIQRTLVSTPSTEVFRNFKLSSKTGRKREIDVLVISNINEMEIRIAIECKDYKRKVSAEKVEAFNSKCDVIGEIHKKVFVSSNGFQPAAIESAKALNIQLYSAFLISEEEINSWIGLSVKKLGFKPILPFSNVVLHLPDLDPEYLERANLEFDGMVIQSGTGEKKHIGSILVEVFNNNLFTIFKYGLLQWVRIGEKRYEPFPFKISVNLNGVYFTGPDERDIQIMGVDATLKLHYFTTEASISDARIYSEFGGKYKASSITVDMAKGSQGNIISKEGQTDIYLTDQGGKSSKLETLLKYDPKTDSFSIP